MALIDLVLRASSESSSCDLLVTARVSSVILLNEHFLVVPQGPLPAILNQTNLSRLAQVLVLSCQRDNKASQVFAVQVLARITAVLSADAPRLLKEFCSVVAASGGFEAVLSHHRCLVPMTSVSLSLQVDQGAVTARTGLRHIKDKSQWDFNVQGAALGREKVETNDFSKRPKSPPHA